MRLHKSSRELPFLRHVSRLAKLRISLRLFRPGNRLPPAPRVLIKNVVVPQPQFERQVRPHRNKPMKRLEVSNRPRHATQNRNAHRQRRPFPLRSAFPAPANCRPSQAETAARCRAPDLSSAPIPTTIHTRTKRAPAPIPRAPKSPTKAQPPKAPTATYPKSIRTASSPPFGKSAQSHAAPAATPNPPIRFPAKKIGTQAAEENRMFKKTAAKKARAVKTPNSLNTAAISNGYNGASQAVDPVSVRNTSLNPLPSARAYAIFPVSC